MKKQAKTMAMEVEDLDVLIEEATVDCNDEVDCRAGFMAMIEDFVLCPFDATVKGQSVEIENVFEENYGIRVLARTKDGTFPLDVLDIKFDRKRNGCWWLAAYQNGQKETWETRNDGV
ncbi:MAG: hypothetical protein Q7S57_04435 [bacterium]|nr:hypothetical protein [bacterium]